MTFIGALPFLDVGGARMAQAAMARAVFLDNNVWDFLLGRKLDLVAELSRDRFSVWMTREAEFEIKAIPDEKTELKAFIAASIAAAEIGTHAFFGFADPALPIEEQRVGGFNVGWWMTEPERIAMERFQGRLGKLMKTRLYKNEADIALATRSFVATVVTLDTKKVLRVAAEEGGDVVQLAGFDESGLTLAAFIDKHRQS